MINNLFLLVLKMSASASVVILLLVVLTSVLNKRYYIKWKYRIWLILAVYLSLPVDYAAIYRQLSYQHNVKPMTIPAVTQVTNAIMVILDEPALAPQNIAGTMETASVASVLPSPLTIISHLWIISIIVLLFVYLISYTSYKKKLMQNAMPLTNEAYNNIFSTLLKDMGITNKLKILVYPQTSSPMVIGFIKPVLVLPHDDYSVEEIQFILRHELIHYKRHDIYGKLLLLFAKTIHWFNPIIALMYREAIIDMELSCDEGVVGAENFTLKMAYAETLFSSLAKQNKSEIYFSTQFQGGTEIMKKRFQNILSKTTKRNGRILLTATLLLVIVLGTLMGCSDTASNTEIIGGADSETTIEVTETEAANESTTPDISELAIKQHPAISDAIITLNEFTITYFTGDADAVKPYLADTYNDDIKTYSYGNIFNNVSELTIDAVACLSAGEVTEAPWSFLGVSSRIETEYDNLLIDGVEVLIPIHEIEDGYSFSFTIALKAMPYKDIDLDYREYLIVELIRQGDSWKVRHYALEA